MIPYTSRKSKPRPLKSCALPPMCKIYSARVRMRHISFLIFRKIRNPTKIYANIPQHEKRRSYRMTAFSPSFRKTKERHNICRSSRSLLFFGAYDFLSVVISAVLANLMGLLEFMAMRALHQRGSRRLEVRISRICSLLRLFGLGYRHFIYTSLPIIPLFRLLTE